MGFDLLAAGLGELFFGGAEAAAAAAPEVGLLGADVGAGALEAGAFGAADIGAAGAADIGAAGAADLGAAGAADLGGAAATDIAETAAPAADLGVAGAGATDLAGGVTPAVADTLASAVPGADAASLGENVGGTLAFSGAPQQSGDLASFLANPAGGQAAATPVPGATAELPGPTTLNFAQDVATGENQNIQNLLEDATGGTQSPTAGALPQDVTTVTPADPTGGAQSPGLASASAPTTAAATPAPKAGGGLTSGLSDALNSPYTKLAELGLPLGMLGYTLAKGPAPIPPQAQQAVSNAQAVAPALVGQATQNVPLYNQTAATDLNLANNFQINPAQAATIATWKQDQYNQLRQQIANQGITNVDSSSQWVQGKNQIDQQALAQQTQMINQLITTAFQASSAANAGVSTGSNVTAQMDSTLMQAAQLQVQQDAAFNQAVGSSLQSFGLLAALSGKFGGSKDAATA